MANSFSAIGFNTVLFSSESTQLTTLDRLVNLRGEMSGKPISVKNGLSTVGLKAFAPASFVIVASEKKQP